MDIWIVWGAAIVIGGDGVSSAGGRAGRILPHKEDAAP